MFHYFRKSEPIFKILASEPEDFREYTLCAVTKNSTSPGVHCYCTLPCKIWRFKNATYFGIQLMHPAYASLLNWWKCLP